MCDYCKQILIIGGLFWENINKTSCSNCFEKARKESVKKLLGE